MHSNNSAAGNSPDLIPEATAEFYLHGMRILKENGIPFLVGGARALCCHTGINRHTKDFDIFLRASDLTRALEAARAAGYRAELVFPHWLAKIFHGEDFIDLIFRAGNGLCPVDDSWIERGVEHDVLGVSARICAAEEMIFPKAFVMERERYDGADIAHIFRACAEQIDYRRLIDLFGGHWRLLLNQLILFGFVYPGERDKIPQWVLTELLRRLMDESGSAAPSGQICNGTLISREQYLRDIREWGYLDARLEPGGAMSAEQIDYWTKSIGKDLPDEFHKLKTTPRSA